jgi:2',3'-cyclic-nucleotide 2'-phosphodiesterase (5'-nucleotidase family)
MKGAFVSWHSSVLLFVVWNFAFSFLTAIIAVVASSSNSTSVESTNSLPSPPHLTWGDVNILIVTDVHSWIGGHARHHETSLWNESIQLDIDYGDVLSFYEHLLQYANSSTSTTTAKNLFFVMNGDFTDGTGLTAFPPTRLCQLLETMPWDAINIGNHELYRNQTVEGMNHGFIDFWKGRYLTSNVLSSETNMPLGNRYRFLQGPTATILTFGFLYNMTGNCAAAIVEPVQQVIQQDWFGHVLSGKDGSFDAILVLAHMDYLDPLVTTVLLPALRQHVGPDMPIQFVTGHSHIRGFAQLDSYSSTLEAGRYLDTLGFVSFPIHSTVVAMNQSQSANNTTNETTSNSLFKHVLIDANREALGSVLNSSYWATPNGTAFTQLIHRTQQEMGLLQPLGCSPETYYVERGLDDDQSLWNVYTEQVIPLTLLARMNDDPSTDAVPIFVQGSGAFRYDLFEGLVLMDDIIAVCPFRDAVYEILPSVRGQVLKNIVDYNEEHWSSSAVGDANHTSIALARTRKPFSNRLPPFVIVGDLPLVDDQVYQLLAVDFDLKYWIQRIYNVTGNSTVTPIPIRDAKSGNEVTTTQLWIDFVQTQWSNNSNTTCSANGELDKLGSNSSTDKSNHPTNEAEHGQDHQDNIWLWRFGMTLLVFILVSIGIFITWRILCLTLWRYREGYTVPLDKQNPPTESVIKAATESLTDEEDDEFGHNEA